MVSHAEKVEAVVAAAVEYEVKAAFIHNFTQFIQWPPEAFETEDAPLRIGILGKGPIDTPLLKLDGAQILQRTLKVSKIPNLQGMNDFHVIYVNPSEIKKVPLILRTLKGKSVLTIGDTRNFAENCGMINFFLDGGKVRFEVNIEASRRGHLQISSKLLRLARIVDSQCD